MGKGILIGVALLAASFTAGPVRADETSLKNVPDGRIWRTVYRFGP